MFHVEFAPWGVFLPSEVRFRGILALSRAWFYNGQKQKCKFLKKPSWPDFQILCGDSWGNFTKNGTNLRPGEFFFVFDPFSWLWKVTKSYWRLIKANDIFYWSILVYIVGLIKMFALRTFRSETKTTNNDGITKTTNHNHDSPSKERWEQPPAKDHFACHLLASALAVVEASSGSD